MPTAPDRYKFRGYAGIIRNTMTALNDNADFRRRYARVSRRFLFNSPHWQYAALVDIDKGAVRVDAVANQPVGDLSRAVLRWDGFVEMESGLFLALLTRRCSMIGVMRKWLAGEIKLRGWRNLFLLWDLSHILTNNKLRGNSAVKEET
jgi:hypothetical protein